MGARKSAVAPRQMPSESISGISETVLTTAQPPEIVRGVSASELREMIRSHWDSSVGNTAERADGDYGDSDVEQIAVPDIDSDNEYVPRCVWFSRIPFGK